MEHDHDPWQQSKDASRKQQQAQFQLYIISWLLIGAVALIAAIVCLAILVTR